MSTRLSTLLHERRHALDLGVTTLAAAVGVTRQTIYQWESGVIPHSSRIASLAAALRMPEALLREEYLDAVRETL